MSLIERLNLDRAFHPNKELPKLNVDALHKKTEKKTEDVHKDQVINKRPKVFADIYDHIIEELEPIFDPESAIKLGIKNPQKPQINYKILLIAIFIAFLAGIALYLTVPKFDTSLSHNNILLKLREKIKKFPKYNC